MDICRFSIRFLCSARAFIASRGEALRLDPRKSIHLDPLVQNAGHELIHLLLVMIYARKQAPLNLVDISGYSGQALVEHSFATADILIGLQSADNCELNEIDTISLWMLCRDVNREEISAGAIGTDYIIRCASVFRSLKKTNPVLNPFHTYRFFINDRSKFDALLHQLILSWISLARTAVRIQCGKFAVDATSCGLLYLLEWWGMKNLSQESDWTLLSKFAHL